jgi:hypothetical protein
LKDVVNAVTKKNNGMLDLRVNTVALFERCKTIRELGLTSESPLANASVAQQAELSAFNRKEPGSIPVGSAFMS